MHAWLAGSRLNQQEIRVHLIIKTDIAQMISPITAFIDIKSPISAAVDIFHNPTCLADGVIDLALDKARTLASPIVAVYE
ncbi:hypothetical protein SCHPADRAFT_947304 [Schizopora paradoxa]|uniref:Uncharacterized protein n=1 Tax=Schizopora paradoxa TaxID=27342 RepID=A0A0H2R692_9AGAM|nr:hypothetical protein SCHPADRAFT_947304 [Schizopora paradoxa]